MSAREVRLGIFTCKVTSFCPCGNGPQRASRTHSGQVFIIDCGPENHDLTACPSCKKPSRFHSYILRCLCAVHHESRAFLALCNEVSELTGELSTALVAVEPAKVGVKP